MFDKLGDLRERAVTMSKVADVLQARGEFVEALRIREQEELPIFERLGDARSRAVAIGKIASVLQMTGELDEALRLRREEELPVFERIGDVRALVIARTNLALALVQLGRPEDGPEILCLLGLALRDARRLHLRDARRVADLIRSLGADPDAPPFV